jgi:hypothetical protein
MKNKTAIIARRWLLPALLLTLNSQLPTASAQGTAFTYQGRLNSGGAPASGLFDFRFRLDADAAGNTILGTAFTNAVAVSSGLFTTTIDFGASQFTGSNLWLEVDVKTNGAANYTALAPLQAFTPTPYALFATTASNLSGAVSAAQISGGLIGNSVLPPSPIFSGTVTASSISGNGANVTNVNAALLNGKAATNFWQTGGNAGTSPTNGNFLGTTDSQPLELRVNGQRAFRLEPNTSSSAPNIVGGSMANSAAAGVVAATVGGGGQNGGALIAVNTVTGSYGTVSGGAGNTAGLASVVGGGYLNSGVGNNATVGGGAFNSGNGSGSFIGGGGWDGVNYGGNTNAGNAAVIVGGMNNSINYPANYSAIGGGQSNSVAGVDSTIAGGIQNQIKSSSGAGFIGGGSGNIMDVFVQFATIAGGVNNYIGPNAGAAAIGGGQGNSISAYADFATIPGGYANMVGATANCSLAAGYYAQAAHPGSFVWCDGSVAAYTASIAANSWTARVTGGARFISAVNGSGTPTAGVSLAAGGGSWTSLSDRNAKEHFADVDAKTILAKVAAMPVLTWNYKTQPTGIRHIGPMAQDFKAAFNVGESDTGITTVDEGGVALAAIQGLNEKVESGKRKAETQMEQLADENAALKQSVAELKQLVQTLVEKK